MAKHYIYDEYLKAVILKGQRPATGQDIKFKSLARNPKDGLIHIPNDCLYDNLGSCESAQQKYIQLLHRPIKIVRYNGPFIMV